MAVIQKIRNQYGKLAGGVIAIALIGFIVSDARNGSLGNLFGGRDNSVMTIDGQKIDQKEYQERLKEYETLYTMFNKGKALDEATRAQMNEQALQFIVFEKALGDQAEKLGVQTTKAEEQELIYGVNPDPMIQQFQLAGQQIFLNPETHQYDPSRVKGFEQQIPQIDQQNPTLKAGETWEVVKNYVRRSNRINKMNALIMNSYYTPKFIAQAGAKEQNRMAGIRFVKVPFTTVPDNDVKVSDDDLKKYMKEHEAMFTNDQPTRSIEYVSFDVKPSQEDTGKSLTVLQQLKGEFETTKDNENFVNRNSEDKYVPAFVNKKSFMSAYADTILAEPAGGVFGPYYENGSYKLTKVIDKAYLSDSVHVRHILVKTKDQGKVVLSDSAAKKRLDSAVALIKGGMPFDSAVVKYSNDFDGKNTKGDYTFTLQGRANLVKEFGDFAWEGNPGENKIVKVDSDIYQYNGYHYIEILEQKGSAPAARLATISKPLFAGETTQNAAYAKATEFAGKNGTAKAFDDAVKKERLDKRKGDRIKPTDFNIPGLGANREVVRWIYDHKVGEVSPVFTLEGRYVVAKLTTIQDKGMIQLDETIRPMLESTVRMEKKAERINAKYKSMTSVEAIAQAAGQQVMHADTVSLGSPSLPLIGFAPKVVGYTFYQGLKPNTTSPGIKGGDGVFFISVNNRWEAPADPMMMQSMAQQRMMQQAQAKNAMGQMLQQAIFKKAKIKYNAANI